MPNLKRLSAVVVASVLLLSFVPQSLAKADGVDIDKPPAGKFPGVDRELDRVLKQRVVASEEPHGAPVAGPVLELDSPTGVSMTSSSCHASEGYCVEIAPVSKPADSISPQTSWPNVCSANQSTTTDQWLALSRKAACNHQGFSLTVREKRTGTIVGTATFHFGMTAESIAGSA